MKKVCCVLACCIFILCAFSGCEKRDPLAGTIWVEEKQDSFVLEFFEDGKYKKTGIEYDPVNGVAKKNLDSVNIKKKDYEITGDKKLKLYDFFDCDEEFSYKIEDDYLILLDNDGGEGWSAANGVYKRIKSYEQLAEFHNCEWIEEE